MVKKGECIKCGFEKENYDIPEAYPPYLYNMGIGGFENLTDELLSENIMKSINKFKEMKTHKDKLKVLVLVNIRQFDYLQLAEKYHE